MFNNIITSSSSSSGSSSPQALDASGNIIGEELLFSPKKTPKNNVSVPLFTESDIGKKVSVGPKSISTIAHNFIIVYQLRGVDLHSVLKRTIYANQTVVLKLPHITCQGPGDVDTSRQYIYIIYPRKNF